jgi:hypothetical protein
MVGTTDTTRLVTKCRLSTNLGDEESLTVTHGQSIALVLIVSDAGALAPFQAVSGLRNVRSRQNGVDTHS